MRGFSRSNLFYMRTFAAAWDLSDPADRNRVGGLPWGHIELLKLKNPEIRNWYEAFRGVAAGTFVLRAAGTTPVIVAAVGYNPATGVATLNANAALAANRKYTATLSASIKDCAGNPLIGTSWSFTTGR